MNVLNNKYRVVASDHLSKLIPQLDSLDPAAIVRDWSAGNVITVMIDHAPGTRDGSGV
jgi:hypothetical protein